MRVGRIGYTRMRVYACILVHACTCTYVHVHVRAYTHMRNEGGDTQAHTGTHRHTQAHTGTHTQAHTYPTGIHISHTQITTYMHTRHGVIKTH